VKKFLVSFVFGISVLSFSQINGNADENGFDIDETNQSILLFVYCTICIQVFTPTFKL
jgi:hypothetical protein